jgi:putative RNA 2'-phosphotransferase
LHRRNVIRVESLSRFLQYVLGHRPDEFGLIPDSDGFIGYKDLLRAIHEEDGWGHVRQGDIHEVLMGEGRALFDSEEGRIRSVDRRWEIEGADILPKILYVAVRRRAHAHAMEEGLTSERGVRLSPEAAFAEKIGRRRDPKPVLLEVHTSSAQQKGAAFLRLGELYLSKEIPAGCITGPPVEVEEVPERKEIKGKGEKPEKKPAVFMPGSFLLDPNRDPAPHRRQHGKKAKGWKEEARKLRKRRSE